ncbi:Flp family type IVb pilin [Segeticoccus rhizosphaerae]|uniref:Flp family type IVb pilin n=1 Tax=Segeticoccus rhizosphaerae TaxID=1104777 RepID=UPI0010BF8238|nr:MULTISPECIES: Flp family type IVb pilin [Intrasporangiaceae]
MTSALVKLQTRAFHLLQDKKDRGATAVEYGIMVALIAAIIIVVVAAVGQKILGAFNLVNTNLP